MHSGGGLDSEESLLSTLMATGTDRSCVNIFLPFSIFLCERTWLLIINWLKCFSFLFR